MTKTRARDLATWIKANYGNVLANELAGTPFSVTVGYAIACKETGIYLVDFIKQLDANVALERCVFDASGDAAGTSRSAFPRNTAKFRERYGADFTEALVEKANESRALRGLDAASWVYKGYGIFQYDLQHVGEDEGFFRNQLWGDFGECAARLKRELMRKYQATGNVLDAIQRYNGTGPKSVIYRSHVEQLMAFCDGI